MYQVGGKKHCDDIPSLLHAFLHVHSTFPLLVPHYAMQAHITCSIHKTTTWYYNCSDSDCQLTLVCLGEIPSGVTFHLSVSLFKTQIFYFTQLFCNFQGKMSQLFGPILALPVVISFAIIALNSPTFSAIFLWLLMRLLVLSGLH